MKTDILIIGGGGAAARAAIECRDKNVIIAVKGLFGKSGCTVMAEGGYNAVFNPKDSFKKHFYDTVKGGGFINNSKLVEILVKNSPKELLNLEKFGALFDRNEDGFIAQRPFGGQSFNRTCYCGDRTGHEIMRGLMEYISKFERVKILEEVTAIKLIVKDNRCYGAIFLDLKTGEIFPIFAKATILATGGAGQLYPITSNPIQKTGDGFAIAYNEGAELIDMEMVQFHPTGMVGTGILVTEAVRGEGGILYNKNKERFMARYDKERMELSTRDVVARAIYREIQEGRGVNGGVYLDVSHLPAEVIEKKLETMLKQFLRVGIDIRKEPMIVSPTAHHFMGGLRINEKCETSIIGLFACGEVTGGVHGANRLGGNALADTQVFGAIAGKSAKEFVENNEFEFVDCEEDINNILDEIKGLDGNLKIYSLIEDLKKTMWDYVSIIRNEEGLKKALEKIDKIEKNVGDVKVNGVVDLQKYFELKNMVVVAQLVTKSALYREESRGAHYREDFPETDEKWRGNIIIKGEKMWFEKLDYNVDEILKNL
ncbi:fumarate reductase (CoM/CoB) subunit TfrA [Methanocaldococcus fervens]|uniref:Fumarate reductase/succinate dehydrogenase flavoprotein domain protein n=1 Tax=Methanocaldococcus fervens (strain DSM 4213 / JCM 15782 / AG86) TaxID=573064 RepID=C7P915_METFA|nr:fumarate reductase (CoM/CoB) subunit TfrA [Methanocaldococcus fervens]ACV25047.1 fumarate reductase/succinate dehydrogenase flavoprotein domain protein [Methanocaldococcus fervens AG86]